MTSETKKGICLTPPKMPTQGARGGIAEGVTALLVYAAFVLTVWQVTGAVSLPVMLAAGAVLLISCTVLGWLNRQRWFYTGVLLFIFLLVIFAGGRITEGLRLFLNRLGDTYTGGTGIVMNTFITRYPGEEQVFCSVLFEICTACVLTMLAGLGARYVPLISAVLLPAALLVGNAVFKSEISALCVIVTLSAAMLAAVSGGWGKRKPTFAFFGSAAVSAVVILALVLLMLLPSVKSSGESLSRNVHEKYHESRYETAYTTLPEGDFTDFTTGGETVPALVVTMEVPEQLYLRGFTGAYFEDGVWKPVENSVLGENSDLLYWINLEEFSPLAQFEAAAGEEYEGDLVTVQNIGACSSFIYVPYSLKSEGFGEYLQPEVLNTDYIAAEGERTYVYSVISGGTEIINTVLEYLQTSDDESVLRYRQAESAYRQFVYDNYLQLSPEMRDALGTMFAELGILYDGGELTKEQAQEYALRFLSLCFSEEAADLELPLENAEGTSFQYATVGTLVLRYLGIPARYAEGYIISEQLAAKAQPNESITVDSSCAQGWIEVYQDGIGWIPMALTPGLGEKTQEQESGSTENTAPQVQEGEELEEEPQTEINDPQPDGGSLVTLGKAIKWTAIVIVLAALVLILILIIRRKTVLKRKAAKFASDNLNDAVAWIFADTAVLMEYLGLSRNGGSMTELYAPAKEQFGDEYAMRLRNAAELNSKAMFSSRPMSEEQLTAALSFRDDTAALINTREKLMKRLWIRWIRCLY